MSDSPQAFINQMLTSIVALEIAITRLVGKFKLGQNKETRDLLGAAHALKARGADAIADAMLSHVANDPDGDAS